MIIMNTTECYDNCYSRTYTWKVYRFSNTFVGYVVSRSQYNAYFLAKQKYGDFIWLEREQ